jgi:activator of 2-hydroxyglutaryl-CoA dehydratase
MIIWKAQEVINTQIDGIFTPQIKNNYKSFRLKKLITAMRQQEYAIGIDIGGTNTVFGVVDHRGDILYRGAISTRKH